VRFKLPDYFSRTLLFLSLLSLNGCVYGLLYTDVTEPFTLDMNRTPNPEDARTAEVASQRLTEPLTGLDIRVEFNSNALGDATEKSGIDTIYYADIRHQSILLGIWQKDTLIVVGR
jgi:hypothetical protein